MLKKMTRRRFVSSLSVLAAMPLLSSRAANAAAGKTVSVNQYNNNDWIAAFKQAFSEGDTVVVPAGFTCENINTGIFIPDGKTLLMIEHDVKLVMGICDRLMVLDYGKTLTSGTPDTVRRDPAVIAAWLGGNVHV